MEMLRAMKLVQTTRISVRDAAELCKVPRSTLWDRLNKLKIANGEKGISKRKACEKQTQTCKMQLRKR
jgi:predicted DNA-binding protein (UPF0251 family)